MSHVDDGTLHAYLDGELAPAEAQGVGAHLAQCPACRGRVEEERALITRAGEVLALAAPPDRELPPFRAGDAKPLKRLWWQVRLPLAWAATVVLALGIGSYLGSGSRAPTDRSVAAPLAAKRAAPPPAPPTPAAREQVDRVAPQRKATPAPAPAPQAAFGVIDGALVEKGSPISVDSARTLLGTDPFAVPGAPIRAIHPASDGYSAVVTVEQALDSITVIEVTSARPLPLALGEVVVTGAPASRADSVGALERARGPRPSGRLMRDETRNRPVRRVGTLEIHISGPLPSDSLQRLLRLVQPVKP